MAIQRPDESNLTPGVLDGYAVRAFTQGACGALALAFHDVKGWDLIAVTDSHNVYDGHAGGGSALHYMVRHPNGLLLDVDGFHRDEDVTEEYDGEADDGESALGITTVADIKEWYIENQGGPISVEFAKGFIDAVLKRAEERGVNS